MRSQNSTIVAVVLAFVAMLTGPLHHALVDHARDTKKAGQAVEAASDGADRPKTVSSEGAIVLGEPYLEPLRLALNLSKTLPFSDLPEDVKLDFAIVTVPDPGETAVDYIFDRVIDSVLRASQRLRYSSDRFYFPWVAEKGDKTVISHGVPGTLLLREAPQQGRAGKSYLLVFLVGEAATWGIDPTAFATAVEAIAQSHGPISTPVIKLLGPYFSGSARSLHDAIAAARRGHPGVRFKAVSGSTTSASVGDTIKQDDPTTTFTTTQLSDTVLKRAIFQFLIDKGHVEQEQAHCRDRTPYTRLKKVALLVESSTGFGQANLMVDASGAKKTSDCNHEAGELAPEYLFPYPMHIAQVRSAWEKARVKAGRPETPDAPSPVLELSLEDLTLARDVPPAMSTKTSFSEELNLAQIFYTVCNEDIEYLGLVATDTSDRLFLAREIRKRCPDVQVFVTNADILYVHPDYRAEMSGLLVASSYPLTSQSQTLTDRGGERFLRQFASSGAEGVYNAFVLLFDDAEHRALLDHGAPFARAGGDHGQDTPQVWITAVGNASFWPLSVKNPEAVQQPGSSPPALPLAISGLGPGPVAAAACAIPPDLVRITFDPPPAWLLLLAVLSLALLFLSVSAITVALGRKAPPSLANIFEAPGQRKREHWLYTFAFFAGSFCAFAAVWPVVSDGDWAASPGVTRQGFWLEAGLVAACAISSGAAALAALFALSGQRASEEQTSAVTWATAGLSGVGALAIAVFKPLGADGREDRFFLWQRATYLFNGVSPLVPIGVAVFILCAWSWFNLRRLRVTEEVLSFGKGRISPTAFWNDLVLSEEQVGHSLETPFRTPRRLAAVLLFGVLPLIPLLSHLLILERERAWGLFAVLLSASFVVMLVTTLWALFLWRDVHRLLLCLSLHPLGLAFKRLPAVFSRVAGGKVEDPSRLRFGEHVAARLLFEMREDCPTSRRLKNTLTRLEGRSARMHQLLGENVKSRSLAMRQEIHGTSVELVNALRPYWKQWRLAEHLPAAKEGKAVAVPPDPEREWFALAEQFVALDVTFSLYALSRWLVYMLSVATMVGLCLLVLVTSYPFQPHRLLLVEVALGFGGLVVVALLLLLQMERDEVLSNISNSTPGEISWDKDFIVKVVTLVVLPIVGLVASQVPEISGNLVAASDALMRVLK